jgi:hypothetical protein
MIRLTEKNYKNLPEVRKKRNEELMRIKKKEELINRLKNAKEFEQVSLLG